MKPHIAFIHKDFPFGGAEIVTMNVAAYLCAHGCQVTVLVANHHPAAYPEGKARPFSVEMLPEGNVKTSTRIAGFLKSFFLRNHVGTFVSYRELLYAGWLKKQTGVRFVFALQSMPFYEMTGNSYLMRIFYMAKYRRVYRQADAYGLLCETYMDEFRRVMRPTDGGRKLCVLPNSIELPDDIRFEKKKCVLFVGRLSRRDKRIDRLLRVWKRVQDRLADWNLVIVGDGPESNRLHELASSLSLHRVSFEGASSRVADYYANASVLTLTSSFEGWPLVVAEAQANGVIPIFFDSFGAAKELVSNESEGILIPPFDEEEYASRLVGLCNDEEQMGKMRRAVRVKAATYTQERMGRAWMNIIHKIPDL